MKTTLETENLWHYQAGLPSWHGVDALFWSWGYKPMVGNLRPAGQMRPAWTL